MKINLTVIGSIGKAPAYNGPPCPHLEALTHRGYSRRRSRLVDRWLVYADAAGFTYAGSQEVAL